MSTNGLVMMSVEVNDAETAYSVFFKTEFPAIGVVGIIAALAAIVSSLDSYALNGITSVSNDLLSNVRYTKKYKQSTLISVAGAVVYLSSMTIALFFNQILVLVLTALLVYISVLLPIAYAKKIGVNEALLFKSAVLIVLFISTAEILEITTEPKAIVYPTVGLLVMSFSYGLQRLFRWQESD